MTGQVELWIAINFRLQKSFLKSLTCQVYEFIVLFSVASSVK